MNVPVSSNTVKKGTPVKLAKNLPPHGFGNLFEIRSPSSYDQLRAGHVTSEGFEGGMLRVTFDLYPEGLQKLQFNELSAANYLVCDLYSS